MGCYWRDAPPTRAKLVSILHTPSGVVGLRERHTMTNVTNNHTTERVPTYLGSGDPARRRSDYYPAWLDNLADDVTMEGAAMEGAAQGAEAVRAIIVTARTLYEGQEFNYAGPYGDHDFLEDYTTEVHGEPVGVVIVVARNAHGETQHVVVNHRPRSSLLLFSRSMNEKLAGTPYAEHFLASES
jgi:hypothetical protein